MTGNEKNLSCVWEEAVGLLQERASKDVFETWFKDTALGELHENEAILSVPNKFFRDWIRDHYQALLEEVLGCIVGRPDLRVNYSLREAVPVEKIRVTRDPERQMPPAIRSKRAAHLDARYTFTTFVAASNNQLARAASMKVSEAPGTS